MKKLFTAFFYLIWFAVPALIVQYYHHFVDPMTDEEIKMATFAGTLAMIILAVITGFSGRKKSAVKDVANEVTKKAAKTPKVPKTRIVRDPATGAERLFNWNDEEGVWESDDGRTVLDDSRTEEWERQRIEDRKWADRQMEKLRNRDTAFDHDMDDLKRRQEKELADMEKEMEEARKFGEKHGKYDLTKEERKEFLQQQQDKDYMNSLEYQEYGNEYDKIVNRLEWIQWGADFAMDICDVLTLGAGRPIKNLYILSRNTAGDMMDCLVNKKSITKSALKSITKTTIDLTQANVNKIGYKYTANGLGDGIKEAMQNVEEGKSGTAGFFKGLVKGTTRTGVEHGLSNTKFKWNSKQTEIANKAKDKSLKILGQQQSGQLSSKTATALRNNIRTDAAQQIGKETSKKRDLLSNGLGRLTDGFWNKVFG